MRQSRIRKSNSRRSEAREAQTDDEPPRDIDEFRNAMARRIEILIANEKGYWRGCKQPACRRQRGCCAPRGYCSNAPPPPPDPDGRRFARVQAMFLRALNAARAQREEAETAEAEGEKK